MLYAMISRIRFSHLYGRYLSSRIWIWLPFVGRRESIVAATLGGIGVNMAEGGLSDLFFDQWWTLILGVLFFVVLLFLPSRVFSASL